jgi:hypothetical protein
MSTFFMERAGIRQKGTEAKKVLKREGDVIYGLDFVKITKVFYSWIKSASTSRLRNKSFPTTSPPFSMSTFQLTP